jgi:hypothetical protein
MHLKVPVVIPEFYQKKNSFLGTWPFFASKKQFFWNPF